MKHWDHWRAYIETRMEGGVTRPPISSLHKQEATTPWRKVCGKEFVPDSNRPFVVISPLLAS